MVRTHEQKVSRSRDEWAQLMLDYEGSGLTQRAVCEQREITYSAFGYWRTRLRHRAAMIARSVEPAVELCAGLEGMRRTGLESWSWAVA